MVWHDRKTQSAHRVSWKVNRGEIPEGLCVLHKCDNPICVNPEHLFLGTLSDNMQDALSKRRLTAGKKHWNCKLTDRQVRVIRARRDGGTLTKLAHRYGVSAHQIHLIVTNRSRRCA